MIGGKLLAFFARQGSAKTQKGRCRRNPGNRHRAGKGRIPLPLPPVPAPNTEKPAAAHDFKLNELLKRAFESYRKQRGD
jgi:hypothetical protein